MPRISSFPPLLLCVSIRSSFGPCGLLHAPRDPLVMAPKKVCGFVFFPQIVSDLVWGSFQGGFKRRAPGVGLLGIPPGRI